MCKRKCEGMTCLVKCERSLVLEDASRAVQHAAVRALGRRLHALLGGRATTSVTRTPNDPANPYHFDDIERLADEHLSRTVSAPPHDAGSPCSRHGLLLTCAMPPAVPAVRSVSVFDILRLLWVGARRGRERGGLQGTEALTRG